MSESAAAQPGSDNHPRSNPSGPPFKASVTRPCEDRPLTGDAPMGITAEERDAGETLSDHGDLHEALVELAGELAAGDGCCDRSVASVPSRVRLP